MASITPSLTVNDLQQSIKFFAALGFEIDEKWEDNNVLQGVMLKHGDVNIGLSQDDGKKGTDRVKGVGIRLYVEVTGDVDQMAARAKAAGVTLDAEPHDTEWGPRAFHVTEPSGFLMTFAAPWKK
jgi:uncharacterized glyoxalase superfamily protein PhnB